MYTPSNSTDAVTGAQIRDRMRQVETRRMARRKWNGAAGTPRTVPRRSQRWNPATQPQPALVGAGRSEESRTRGRIAAQHLTRLVLSTTAVILAAMSSFIGPAASAHTPTIATQHALTLDSGVLTGQLSSTLSGCLSGRTITLYRLGTAGATAVFNTTTGTTGAWKHDAGIPGGDYYALAAAKDVRSSGHKHTCASAKSHTVTVATDADADGYPTPGDCRDADSAINPGSLEVLNGLDDNCDGAIDEGLEPPTTTCWTPSSEPVAATTTWSQLQTNLPCQWELHVWTVLPGAVYLVSSEWLIEYRPALSQSAAFEYDAQGWEYYATHPNSIYGGA